MNRRAIKFKDIDAFLRITQEMGFDGELKKLLYEDNLLPFCTAYFVPTDLLPTDFDYSKLSLFGGRTTVIREIKYLGIEEFENDFMVFPLSMNGYLEIDSVEDTTFVETTFFDDPEGLDMNFVINIEDGGGKEFYLAQNGSLVGLDDPNRVEPQIFKTAEQVTKQIDILRKKHSESCQVYSVERHEFEARLKQIE